MELVLLFVLVGTRALVSFYQKGMIFICLLIDLFYTILHFYIYLHFLSQVADFGYFGEQSAEVQTSGASFRL